MRRSTGIFSSMREDASEKISKLLRAAEENPYLLSMPLLQAAYHQGESLYNEAKTAMLRAMDIRDNQFIPNDSKSAWLLGRLLIAEVSMGNHAVAASIAEFIVRYLQSEEVTPENCAYNTWAWGYVATYAATQSKEQFDLVAESLGKSLKALKEQVGPSDSNYLWASVLALGASAQQKNPATFLFLANEITGQQKTVIEGLMQIPADDFRLWAFAIVAEAAYDMDGKEMYEGLSDQISKLLESADKEGNDYLLCELLMTRVMVKMTENTAESESLRVK